MGDSRIRLNPQQILFQAHNDKEWKALNTSKISSKPMWILPHEPILFENPDEDLTVGQVGKTIADLSSELKKMWNDKLLNKLECMAQGCCDPVQTTSGM